MQRFRRRSFLAILAVAVLAPTIARSAEKPSLSEQQTSALTRAIEAEIERQRAVGAAVGVIRGGEIVYLRGFGLADREKKMPVTERTVFNWASNCKPLGAVLAMQLVESGQLDLDADVRTDVPEFPDKGFKITCRQLLCHHSGIPHYQNGKIIASKGEHGGDLPYMSPIVALDKFKESPLLFAPGEKESYSSYAYVLLSAAIERAGKAPLFEQLTKRIAEPLGMHSLQYDFPAANQPDWTLGYSLKRDQIVATPEEAHYWKQAAGGFKSNVGDFARWAQGLLRGKLLKPETQAAMWTPQKTTDGKTHQLALGFFVEQRGGRTIVSHNGAQDETRTRMVLDPAAQSGVVILCNSSFVNIDEFERAVSSALEDVTK